MIWGSGSTWYNVLVAHRAELLVLVHQDPDWSRALTFYWLPLKILLSVRAVRSRLWQISTWRKVRFLVSGSVCSSRTRTSHRGRIKKLLLSPAADRGWRLTSVSGARASKSQDSERARALRANHGAPTPDGATGAANGKAGPPPKRPPTSTGRRSTWPSEAFGSESWRRNVRRPWWFGTNRAPAAGTEPELSCKDLFPRNKADLKLLVSDTDEPRRLVPKNNKEKRI